MSKWKELLEKKAAERKQKVNPKAVEAALTLFLESFRELRDDMNKQAASIGKKVNWEKFEIE